MTQVDTLSMSELVRGVRGIEGKSDHHHTEAPEAKEVTLRGFRWIMFVGAEDAFADEPRAKATVLR